MRAGVAAVVLAALSFALLIPNHPAGRDPAEDTGVFFYAAQRLLDGGVPYRDIWDHKPPGVYLVDAVGLAIARETGVWLVQIAFLVVAALLGYRALRREFGDVPAFVGSVAWLLALPRLFLAEQAQTSFVEFYALPLQFGALLLFSREIRAPTIVGAVAMGVLGGAALLFKPTLIGVWLAIGAITLVQRRRDALAPLGLIAVGALLPLAIVVAWAAARGVLNEMVDQALAYNRAYAAFAPLGDRVAAVVAGLRLTLPSGLALVAIGAWLYAVLARRTSPALILVALISFPLEIALATWGRGYHYYFIPWLLPMAILTAFAVSEVQRIVPARIRVALAAAVLLMCVQPALLITRLAMSTGDGQFRSAAGYIAANTRPDDTVLIWGSHAEVLFMADRVSPTRYVYQYAALATRGYASPARVLELLRDLERARPLLIFDASGNSFVTPPLDLAGWRAWVSPEPQYAPLPELERVVEFVMTNYERAGSEPSTGWPMWKLRTP
jgi:hypothetical protein